MQAAGDSEPVAAPRRTGASKPASAPASASVSQAGVGPRQPPGSAGIVVIGIDPGSACTGWGVVREAGGVLSLVDCGAIRARGADFSARVGEIFLRLSELLTRTRPAEAAIEDVFSGKSVASALKLGQARGAAVAACALHALPVFNYPPTQVKQALVGVGRAEKEQVSFMVGRLLNIRPDWPADTGDALAVAICHLNQRRFARLTAQAKG